MRIYSLIRLTCYILIAGYIVLFICPLIILLILFDVQINAFFAIFTYQLIFTAFRHIPLYSSLTCLMVHFYWRVYWASLYNVHFITLYHLSLLAAFHTIFIG